MSGELLGASASRRKERRRDAGILLGLHPSADVDMENRKSEVRQLACASFHVFRGRAVVKDYERVGSLIDPPRDPQPTFHLVLLTDHDKHSRVVFADSLKGLVMRKRQADEHDEVKLAAERAVALVHNES